MTRRQFLAAAAIPTPLRDIGEVTVPLHILLDGQVQWRPAQIDWFHSLLWPEAIRDLRRCGVRLETSFGVGGVARPPFREPVITGLQRGMLNLVLTTELPVSWDGGRALCGVTTLYRGFHLCMVALNHAHGHQVPFFSVNTCLHELLHALLHDIFENNPKGIPGQAREVRIDFRATSLWLFHDDGSVRESARRYVERLRG